jgi:EAL domain-containing protein (putative c-di-GMP-specific phosphodiesterase class I)
VPNQRDCECFVKVARVLLDDGYCDDAISRVCSAFTRKAPVALLVVNSMENLVNSGFVPVLLDMLRERGLSHSAIKLEISSTAAASRSGISTARSRFCRPNNNQ